MQTFAVPDAALAWFSQPPPLLQNTTSTSTMADTDGDDVKKEGLEVEVRDMKLEQEGDVGMGTIPTAESVKQERSASVAGSRTSTPRGVKRQSLSPVKPESMAQSPAVKDEDDTKVGGDVELRLDANDRPKLLRKQSHKVARRPPPLFLDYEDKTAEATSTFNILTECVYANKSLGTTEHALECDCAEEWGKSNHQVFYYGPQLFYLKPLTFICRLNNP